MCSVVEMTTFIIYTSPEEVVTDGYEGAIYVQRGRDDHIHYTHLI